MATRCYLPILHGTLLIFSLLLPTWSAQHGQETYRHAGSSIMGRLPGAGPLPTSTRGLNSDRDSDIEAARTRELDSLPNKVINDDTHGRSFRADNRAKESESVTKGILHKLDAEMTQTSSNSSIYLQQLCEYTVVIQTGSQDGAGTGSDIRLLLSNNTGDQVYFKHLRNGQRTFERGHKDTFVFRDRPCIADICQTVLYTDDYGLFSEWFVVSLMFKVAIMEQNSGSEPILQEKTWAINEWLPKEDTNEELYTIRDDCDSTST